MSPNSQDTLERARTHLRQLALAQYQYFEDHQTYAANLDALVAATAYRPAEGHHAEVAAHPGRTLGSFLSGIASLGGRLSPGVRRPVQLSAPFSPPAWWF